MGKEIERKFLLTDGAIPIKPPFKYLEIKQGYVSVNKESQTRIRITKYKKVETAATCVKFNNKVKKEVRDEFEFPVADIKEARKLYKKCKWTLEKHRLSFEIGSEHYDLDAFPNGIKFVEVEFKSVKQMNAWVKPRWIGKEITGVNKYSNITLAKKNLRF